MDDEPDRAYSRAPELQDLVALCRALGEEGVRYLLIGGFAVVLHGFVRTTKDIDLLVDPADDKIRMKDTVRDSDRMDVRFLRSRVDDESATGD